MFDALKAVGDCICVVALVLYISTGLTLVILDFAWPSLVYGL